MADLEDQRTPNPASLNGVSDDNLGFDDSSLGLDASHLSKLNDPRSQHPFDSYTSQPSSLMADKDYDQSGYEYSDRDDDDENDFPRAGESKGQGHFQSGQFGDLPANFAKEVAAKEQNFPESDDFDDEAYVRGESEGRDDESEEAVQQGSNPFAVDAGKSQTGLVGGAYVDPQDRPIVGFNPFLNEEAVSEKEEEEEHVDVSQEDNEQYHGGIEGEPAGREYGDGREDQAEYDRLEDDDDSYHQRETAQKVELEHYEDEGVGSRTDEAAEGHSEDERTEEHSEGDLHSPGEFPQRYIHSQETTAFQPEVSETPGQDGSADFESGQYDGSTYIQREPLSHFDEYPDTQPADVNSDKGEVYEDGHRDEGSSIPPQIGQAEDDDLGIVNQGFSDDGEPEGGRVIPEEEEITESEAPRSAIVDTELYEDRREGRAEQQSIEEEQEREEPAVLGDEQQYDDEEEQYSRPPANGGDYEKEEINQEEDMEYAGTVQEEFRQRQPEEEDYNERKKDYGEQYKQEEEEEEMEHEDYAQEEQLKPETADVQEISPTKVDFRQINFDDDEEEGADKTNEDFEQEGVNAGEANTPAVVDDYTAQYSDEEAVDHTTSTERGGTFESYGVGYDEESYKQTGESEFSSRLVESDLLSTERSYVDNLSNVTSPETIPQPLPSPPEPRNLSSFDPLAASDSPGLPEPVGNVGQHGELFQHGFVAAESNTAPFLTAGEVEGETKFGVDGTAITSTSQNNAFLHSDEEEEEDDEEESQHLEQGQTGTTETETSVEEKSADYEPPQHGGEHMEGNDNALMSMSMEGSFYDDGGELMGGEDRRNQPENNFFEERSIAEEGSLLDRLDPKQESSYLENQGLGQVIQGESAVDEDSRYQPQEEEFGVRGSDVDLEPRIREADRPAFEENGVYEEEDKPGGFDSEVDILEPQRVAENTPGGFDSEVDVLEPQRVAEDKTGGFDSEVDILEPQRVSQTQAVELEEVADSFGDHTGLDSTANESESSVDSQHLQAHEVESPKEVEDVVSVVGVSDISPEKPEEPAASVEETPAAGKEEPVVAAQETAGPEAAAATAAVGVAVAAAAAAAAATATTKTTTTVKKSSAKAGSKTTTTTTTTKVTKETKPAAGKVTATKKTEVTTATSKTTPRKPAESRPTTATTEKKTPARPTTSPTKPASATTARSSAPAPSPAQPPAARKPKEVKPATPDEKKKPTTTTTTTTPRTPLATHRTPRPQSATVSTSSTSATTATATTAATRTTRTVTSATTRTTTLAPRPKSTPTKLTNGTAPATLDTKSPAKKPGIDAKTGSARTPIEKKATPKVDTGSKSTTPAAGAARSPTKTTTTPRTPATPKSTEVRSKIGSMENTTHTPGGGHVKIASKKPDFSNVTSKVGSKDKIDHKPGGGNIRIETKKVKVEAKSKVGSLNNTTHKPGGGDKKIESKKLDWKVESKIGSLENAQHVAAGGDKKIETKTLDWKVESKVGSLGNAQHKAGGGEKKIETQKLDWKVDSRVGSLDNATHKAGGGDKKIEVQKTEWKAQSKIGSLDHVKHRAGGGDAQAESQKTSKVQSLDKQGPGSGSEQGAVEVQNGAASEN